MSYHNIPSSAKQSTTNAQDKIAPLGFHYMPDGTLMSDIEHTKLYGSRKFIHSFDLDLSNIAAVGENRHFTIRGSAGSVFNLEIKNEDSHYYNFVTRAFQVTKTGLEKKLIGSVHKGVIKFPKITDDDQYDIYLWAMPGTEHADYNEVRFGDGSLDINNSKGSNSLLLQKVIYQYTDLTLTLGTFSPNSVTDLIKASSRVDDTITVSRGKSKSKTPFTISCEVNAATKSYQIVKQPTSNDILAFIQPVIGSDPIDLPGENIYPTVRAAFTGDDINGAITSGSVVRVDNTDLSAVIAVGDKITTATTTGTVNGAIADGDVITLDENAADLMAVGDKVTGRGCPNCGNYEILVTVVGTGGNAKRFSVNSATAWDDDGSLTFSSKINRSTTTVTVVETSGVATDFTMSQAIQFRDNAPLQFWPRKNYSWPISNYADKIKEGMIILSDTNVPKDIRLKKYKDTITIFENTEKEEIIIKDKKPVIDTLGKKPTIVKGLVTVQEGSIIFDTQQVLALAGDTLRIGGYGESNIFDVHGYNVKFSDLKIALTPITTTTTSSTVGASSTSVAITSRNGILDDISTVSGIGIDSNAVDPTVDSGAGAVSGAGTIVLTAAQELESGMTLTFTGAGQTATITGNIEILEAGDASQTVRFDVERLLSIT